MRSKPIIAIGGPMRAGKDTVIDYIIRETHGHFGVVDTSETLINLYSEKTGIPVKAIRDNKHLHRPGLIALGDAINLEEVAGVAKKAFLRHAELDLDFPGLIFCSIRRASEYWLMKEIQATIVFVTANRDLRAIRPGGISHQDHATETETLNLLRKNSDWIIENNGNLADLSAEVKRMLKTLGFT